MSKPKTFEHQRCPACRNAIGNEARCLGCGRSSYPCAEHWPRFTACSPACLPPHRKKLDDILLEPIPAVDPLAPRKREDQAPWPKVK